jgi:mono/diheme cytochrome c family protein
MPSYLDWFLTSCVGGKLKMYRNWRTKNMRLVFTALTLVFLSGAASFAADTKAGQAAFERACKSCHGPDGTPNPAIEKMMKVEMKDLKSAEVQALSNDDIKKIITGGKDKMRPVTSVSGAALDDVAAYVHTLKK